MPYIEDQGKLIADSSMIIAYLKETYGDPLDSHLSAEQKAIGLAFQRLLEENLYWAIVHTRWMDPTGWALTKQAFFADMPIPFKLFVPALARRGIIKSMHGHGIGRHLAEEIYAIGKRDITAAADFLADKAYFLGDAPSSFDATVYAFLANLIWPPVESPLKQHALQYPNVATYCTRMRDRYYA